MGFLVDVGQTLDFQESKPFLEYIKQHGILQFLHLLKKMKDMKIKTEDLKWGDEIEYHIINLDPKTGEPRIQLNTDYLYKETSDEIFHLQPEYGGWMVEAVPTKAYDCTGDPTVVYANFKRRIEKIKECCKDGDALLSLSVYPLLGVGDYFIKRIDGDEQSNDEDDEEEKDDIFNEKNPITKSAYIHDEIINLHPRFPTLTENIRLRRGEKVCILYPLYKDENTVIEKSKDQPYPGYIHMDAMAFGMGSCCLQLTFGTTDIDQARYLTDQLHVFSSILVIPFFLE